MAKRTYGQYCGLAAALDLLGERWTLLVVRELLPGPRRYQDLIDGLPGIATDLLTTRLRALEGAGLVVRRRLELVGRPRVYELTPRGHELRPAVESLALWGAELLPSPDPDGEHVIEPAWATASMAAAYPKAGELPDGDYRFTFTTEEPDPPTSLTISVEGATATLRYGARHADPVVHLCGPRYTLLALLSGRSTSRPSAVVVEGDETLVDTILATMPAPAG